MLRAVLLCPLVVAMAVSRWGLDPSLLWYRLSTSLKALKAIYTLPEKHVTEFLDSYKLFEQEQVTGKNQEAESTINYYKVLNHLCAVGEVEKMYIPPVMDAKLGIFQNQLLWEEQGVSEKLGIGPGSKVLDVGCGRGRVAHHIASYSGGHVTGLNIDATQLQMAREHAKAWPSSPLLTSRRINRPPDPVMLYAFGSSAKLSARWWSRLVLVYSVQVNYWHCCTFGRIPRELAIF